MPNVTLKIRMKDGGMEEAWRRLKAARQRGRDSQAGLWMIRLWRMRDEGRGTRDEGVRWQTGSIASTRKGFRQGFASRVRHGEAKAGIARFGYWPSRRFAFGIHV